MASTLALPTLEKASQEKRRLSEPSFGIALVTVLTTLALAVHGYHPYAEDGGLYMAGVKRLLNPSLYPQWSAFVTEHLRFSLFAPLVAALVRISHLPLMTVWLILYIATFWLTLYAGWLLALRCYSRRASRCGAVALLAAGLTIPIAGTSLMLMDPYFSARSISTPFALLTLVGILDLFQLRSPPESSRSRTKAIALCFGSLLIAMLVHPLMASYAFGFALLLAILLSNSRQLRIAGSAVMAALAICLAALLYLAAPPENNAYMHVALTRSYWFISQWQWYEQFGLAAPLAILALFGLQRRRISRLAAGSLARTGIVAGTVSLVVAILFARTNAPSYVVARLQPLRIFQFVYIFMILALGAALGEKLLHRKAWRWVATFALVASIMLYAERQTYPHSSHLELPWYEATNRWQRAFGWISANTPVDALFALDANYVTEPGEDAQTFRAISERSALADYSKDGGEASITPALTAAWTIGQAAQTGLNTASDAARLAMLRPLGVSWVVLPKIAITDFHCAYADDSVKVCRLPLRTP
ncbi:hypothetical protein [Granulicella sp. dw_53]|uniref:hypothetical protein n=1 Tax=Granulicella sp. dw_53 TaxID=2719792 RepID=UPI001BD2B268|nr:hypothetical protein [Granulicella sp. dw_53]